jgi:hypothetical protein
LTYGIENPLFVATAFTWYEIAERRLPANSDERELALLIRDSIIAQFTLAEVKKLLEQTRSLHAHLW